MNIKIVQLPLNLRKEEVYPYLSIQDSSLVSTELDSLISHFMAETQKLALPKGIYTTLDIDKIDSDRISLSSSPLVIEGTQTISHFISCKKVSLLTVTIGYRIDNTLAILTKNQPAQSLIFDGIASAAVEHSVEQLDKLLSREILRQGFFPTARYSPGYGDWPLTWQEAILQNLEASHIGVTITPYYLLQPIKSVTALIGWSSIPVERNYTTTPGQKPCQSTMNCQECPLRTACRP